MKNEQIIEANKLIAEFMGYEYIGWNSEKHRAINHTSGYWGKKGSLHHQKVGGSMLLNPLRYHNSYDWLIPVVVRCQELSKTSGDNEWGNELRWKYTRVSDKLAMVIIGPLYEAVIGFIKWHNQNKP